MCEHWSQLEGSLKVLHSKARDDAEPYPHSCDATRYFRDNLCMTTEYLYYQYSRGTIGRVKTHDTMPPIASKMPTKLPSLNGLPLYIQPSVTTKHVLKWPTTVLLTGPASFTMMN